MDPNAQTPGAGAPMGGTQTPPAPQAPEPTMPTPPPANPPAEEPKMPEPEQSNPTTPAEQPGTGMGGGTPPAPAA